MADHTMNPYPQLQEFPLYAYAPAIVHPPDCIGPLKVGPYHVINATCYVWVESRFQNCMPVTNEIPAVSVNFIREEYHFYLVVLQGTPSNLASALVLYMDRIRLSLSRTAMYKANSERCELKSDKMNHVQSKEHLEDEVKVEPNWGGKENGGKEISNVSKVPAHPTPRTEANFNILINRETYLLLSSYNNRPFKMLTWLTNAQFMVDDDVVSTTVSERKRIRIKGGRKEVQLGAKVLKEVMIFIGNRFSHWFEESNEKEASVKFSTLTESLEDSSSNKWTEEASTDTPSPSKSESSATTSDLSKMTTGSSREGDNYSSDESPVKKMNLDNEEDDSLPTLQVILIDEQETGKIIGFKGENIKKIEKISEAYVQMTKINLSQLERKVRAIFFVGTLNNVQRARTLVTNAVQFNMTYSESE